MEKGRVGLLKEFVYFGEIVGCERSWLRRLGFELYFLGGCVLWWVM